MTPGDILIDGQPPPPATFAEMRAFAVTTLGLPTSPIDLWNADPSGHLFHVFELYYLAHATLGRKVEVVLDENGTRRDYFGYPELSVETLFLNSEP